MTDDTRRPVAHRNPATDETAPTNPTMPPLDALDPEVDDTDAERKGSDSGWAGAAHAARDDEPEESSR